MRSDGPPPAVAPRPGSAAKRSPTTQRSPQPGPPPVDQLSERELRVALERHGLDPVSGTEAMREQLQDHYQAQSALLSSGAPAGTTLAFASMHTGGRGTLRGRVGHKKYRGRRRWRCHTSSLPITQNRAAVATRAAATCGDGAVNRQHNGHACSSSEPGSVTHVSDGATWHGGRTTSIQQTTTTANTAAASASRGAVNTKGMCMAPSRHGTYAAQKRTHGVLITGSPIPRSASFDHYEC